MSHRRLPFLPLAAVLLAAAGCSATDAARPVAVPAPPAEEKALCLALHKALPASVAGESRRDPEPRSELTAGWGDAAIVLRCGVPRPAGLQSTQADGVEVNGVNWFSEELEDGARFTTTYRRTYVEVTLSDRFTDMGPLTELAGPVARTVPPRFTRTP
ncbi:DUF3515 domain-containing protein [Streptomyces sp. PKU-MA01144]|uniref:DUF3515 domain-containing protein n=1 Tax=Streptomyces TaxID=1883 RepID=UPI00148160AB|nr:MULTISPECIES: DUF3515 domain-containing protein [Streptomyces]MCY0980889.1 DUF3515 domain-containing protein [Streptomyces tirandamycinicus]NNJ06864.1 DUF3515 domain-containing protein [Streptomyces sp. PKU-MA01144]